MYLFTIWKLSDLSAFLVIVHFPIPLNFSVKTLDEKPGQMWDLFWTLLNFELAINNVETSKCKVQGLMRMVHDSFESAVALHSSDNIFYLNT